MLAIGFGLRDIYGRLSPDAATVKTFQVKIATYNILGQRFDSSSKYSCFGDWSSRKLRISNQVNIVAADIVGMQEVNHTYITNDEKKKTISQRSDVNKFMSSKGYGYYVGGSLNGTPIYYKGSMFTRVSAGEKKYLSRNASTDQEEKTLTWVLLQHKSTSKRFYVYNIHTRSGSPTSGLSTVNSFIKSNSGSLPSVLLGDFNDSRSSSAVKTFLNAGFKNTYSLASNKVGNTGLSNRTCSKIGSAVLDHILVKGGGAKSSEWRNYSESSSASKSTLPSDHGAVRAVVKFKY